MAYRTYLCSLKKGVSMQATQACPIGLPKMEEGTNRKKIQPTKNQARIVLFRKKETCQSGKPEREGRKTTHD